MAKPKSSNAETIQTDATDKPSIRILFQGECPKLTPRGAGTLSYELGLHDESGNSLLRITGNTSSGSFGYDWVELERIQAKLEAVKNTSFQATFLKDLYQGGKSSNNHGFLAAILKAEGIVTAPPDKPASLSVGLWGPIKKKIEDLKVQGISLTDHVGLILEERARKKAEMPPKKKPEPVEED